MNRSVRAVLAAAVLLGIAGCRVEVHDGLSQRDANHITALLLMAGLEARRTSDKDGTFAVEVDEDDFAQAVFLIERSGLPKPTFATLTDVLSDDRLIASPSEERARLNYALSQELSRTVSEIDGVLAARVHIATPGGDRLSREDGQSSASVALHHRQGFDAEAVIAPIQTLIANAVDGLDEGGVSVALFPASDDLIGDVGKAGEELPRPVKPAGFVGGQITPALATILLGGLVVLLLVGRALLSGTRRRKGGEETAPRRRPR